jgi:putative oxidoreductase
MIQRLYSTFPGALPGVGLLILRLAAGLSLVVSGFLPNGPTYGTVNLIFASFVGGCLVLGFRTPIAAAIHAGSHLWALISAGFIDAVNPMMIALAVGIVLLGPGAYSLDARFYGRRRVDLN